MVPDPAENHTGAGSPSLEKCTSVDTGSSEQPPGFGSWAKIPEPPLASWVTLGRVLTPPCFRFLSVKGEILITFPASLEYWMVRYDKARGGFRAACSEGEVLSSHYYY